MDAVVLQEDDATTQNAKALASNGEIESPIKPASETTSSNCHATSIALPCFNLSCPPQGSYALKIRLIFCRTLPPLIA